MELAFANRPLRKLCENEAAAVKALGAKVAKQLMGRLADLQAAQNIHDLVVGSPRVLSGELKGHMAISLCDGFALIICTNHWVGRGSVSGEVNWLKATRIQVVSIKQYES